MEKNITNSPTSETAGQVTADFLKDDETKAIENSEEVKSGDSELHKDNRIFDHGENVSVTSLSEDGIKHDDSGKMDADMDLESVSRGGTLSNDIEQVDQGKELDEEKNVKSKIEEEKTQTTKEYCGDSIKHNVSGESETNSSMNLDPNSKNGLLNNEIDKVEQGEKMDEEQSFKSKIEEEKTQTTKENCGDSSQHNVSGESNLSMGLDSSSQQGYEIDKVDQGEKMDEQQDFKSMVVQETKQTARENYGDSTKHSISSADLEYKSQQGTVSSNIEQVEQVEKMDKGNNLEFQPDEETDKNTRDDCGDNVKNDDLGEMGKIMDLKSVSVRESLSNDIGQVDQVEKRDEGKNMESKPEEDAKLIPEEYRNEESNPIWHGTKVPVVETKRCISFNSLGDDAGTEGPVRPVKGKKLRDFVKSKSVVAVTSFLRAVSGKFNEERNASDSANDKEATKVPPKPGDRSTWNFLSFIIRDNDAENKSEQEVEVGEQAPEPLITKGRVILYTRLGCQSCQEVRLFLYNKRLRYVEINIDVYPGRKQELEKFAGSCVVPKVFFNEVVIGGLSELKSLDESGKLEEKIDYLITEAPAYEAPLPPLSGEDDTSSCGPFDELALIVRRMKESIVVKDRFFKIRRFSRCFLGSDAVNFLSNDQILEKEEAVEFGRKLASKLFFQHVLQENLFEDGNHLYWFLDDNPTVSSQCHNIPRGICEVKQKPVREIASRLRFLSNAIYEAYLSEDGKHVDYRTIHGSEEFARYLRIIQELQRAEFQDTPREEKLAFFINLYNMMTIHAILILGHPNGPAERRKLLGDFKYLIGGCSYSLSDIQNGILRCNQLLPFTLTKPFGVNDKRAKMCLPYPEPLIHFALVLGTRSGPALRCYSPGDIDKELMDSARFFLRGGGLIVDLDAKVAYPSKLLKWFSVDFGKTEVEILKHASNYLEPATSEALLELLANYDELKVIYQHYDWGLNL